MTSAHHPLPFVGSGNLGERRPVGRRKRRIALGLFFASVAVNAGLGVYAVLAPEFGDTQGRILGTSLCVTGAALLALACEPAWERKLLGPVPYLGAALGTLGFGLVIVGIWTDPGGDTFANAVWSTFALAVACVVASLLVLVRGAPGHEWVVPVALGLLMAGAALVALLIWFAEDGQGKGTGSLITVVLACAVAGVLARARLSPGHEWVLNVTLGLLALGAALVAIAPWIEDPSEWYLRGMGVILIALAAFAVTVPVLHWIDRGTLTVAGPVTGEVRHCPYCGSSLSGEAGAALSCRRCGREFVVTAGARASSDLT